MSCKRNLHMTFLYCVSGISMKKLGYRFQINDRLNIKIMLILRHGYKLWKYKNGITR